MSLDDSFNNQHQNKKSKNHLADEFDCVFNRNDDCINESSARPNTHQSAKLVFRFGEQVVEQYTTTGWDKVVFLSQNTTIGKHG